MSFTEKALEKSIVELFEQQGYCCRPGGQIHREKTEILMPETLRKFLRDSYAKDGITENEINSIIAQLNNISGTDYEANRKAMGMIGNGFALRRENPQEKDLFINLIDFARPERNIFDLVTQEEIQGRDQLRIPDAVVYINGIPLVVLEFKSAIKENATIEDAYKQLTVRYRRDIPELFKYNAFVVISDGVNNKTGSMFSHYEYFYSWRKIESTDKDSDGINSLITMVEGLFRKDRITSVIKDFVYFPDSSSRETKLICRYPQFFAAKKLYASIKQAMKPAGNGKGGIYFGATGCGKSYTMVFLSRLLMKSPEMHSPTILIISDRTDLDDQLGGIFMESRNFIGDNAIECIQSREKLNTRLENHKSGGVFLTTIQKFCESTKLLSKRANIICISDEAHRSQNNIFEKVVISERGVEHKSGFAAFLHKSLPNATYVGFTGTPIDEMEAVFGDVADKYTMQESVADGITVNLVYEGRAAKVILDRPRLEEIENYYLVCESSGANAYQVDQSKKAVANIETIMDNPDVIEKVAADFIEHYETRVRENATVEGKAMFVCLNREIAYHIWQKITELRPEWNIKKLSPDEASLTEREKKELKPVEMIKMVMTENKAKDTKGLYELLGNNDYRKELDRQFKNIKSNFKIAIVVDMWITGFDVPALDTIYIYKPLHQHSLIQTISRVNRVYKGKDKGVIVDYIGIRNAMNKALKTYSGGEKEAFDDTDKAADIVKDTLSVLNEMFHSFDRSGYDKGTPLQQLMCLKAAVEFIQRDKDTEETFMGAVLRLKKAYNLCSASEKISNPERDLIYFYTGVRSILFKLNKGDAPDIAMMNRRVKEMVNEAISSEGVEEIFQVGRHISEELFSEEYINRINRLKLPNTKVKLLQQLLEKAISDYRRTNRIKAVEFSERLRKLVEEYNSRHYDEFTAKVIDDVAARLNRLFNDICEDREKFKELGISFEEKAFYDILVSCAKKFHFEHDYPDEKMKELARKVKKLVDDKTKYTDWDHRIDVKAEMEADLIILLDENGYPPVPRENVYQEVLGQAENFRKYR